MWKKLCIVTACAGAGVLLAEAPSAYAIRNATVVTVSGPVLKRGTVVVRDGLIQDVGENVTVPADAWVIEGEGLTVYPGLIDALSTWGITETTPPPAAAKPTAPAKPDPATPSPPARPAGPEDRPSNTSWVRAADLVNTSDRRLETARNAGFTTAVAFPTRGIFAGEGAVINLAGQRAGDMVVHPRAGLYMTLATGGAGGYPASLMGTVAYIRQVFLDLDHYRLAKEAYARNPSGLKRPAYDRALEGLVDSPRILLPATSAVQIERALRLAEELKVRMVVYGGHQAYRVPDLLAKSQTPVLVSLKWPERERDADPADEESLQLLEMRDRAPSVPGVLAKAGVSFAFYSDGTEIPRDVLRAARRAIVAGLSQDDAVRAFTLNPARIYGVSDRLGSIERGKIANLVVTSGELFQDSTVVKYVFVDGVKFEPAPEPREEKKP